MEKSQANINFFGATMDKDDWTFFAILIVLGIIASYKIFPRVIVWIIIFMAFSKVIRDRIAYQDE